MLLLVTILLVVVGTISLVIGYAQSSLLPIYVSIGCSVVAAAVLLIFSRLTAKSQPSDTATDGASSLGFAGGTEPAPTGSGYLGRQSDAFAPDHATAAAPPVAAAFADDDIADDTDDDDFPIERYDSRRVGEILPLLAELDVDELDMVREREERGKGRATVLARIDQLIEQLEDEDRQEAEHRFDAPAAPDRADTARQPVVAAVAVAPLPIDDGYFPIEEYDDLRASEILPLLPELDDDELGMVLGRERAGAGRSSILHRIDALLDNEPVADGPGPVPTVEEADAFEPELAPEPELDPEPVPVAAAPVKKARAPRATAAPVTPRPAKTAPPAPSSPAKAPRAPRGGPKAPLPPVKAPRAPKAVAPVKVAPAKSAPVAKAAPAKKAAAVAKAGPAAKAPAKQAAQKRAASPSSVPASKATKKAAKR